MSIDQTVLARGITALIDLGDGRADAAERVLDHLGATALVALSRIFDDAAAMCLNLAGPKSGDGIPPGLLREAESATAPTVVTFDMDGDL